MGNGQQKQSRRKEQHMDGLLALGAANAFTEQYVADTAAQFGAVKGANCKAGTPTNLTDQDDNVIGKRLPIIWKNDEDVTQTTNMDIMYSDIADMVLAQIPTAESIEV